MSIPLQRILHVNLNVAEVAPAVRFFTDVVGLQTMGHMHAEPQDGSAMGLSGLVQWDGYSIHGPRLWDATMIDLLEWQRPRGEGRPYANPGHVGISRLAIAVPDLGALHRRLAGDAAFAGPLHDPASGERFFCARTDDGALLEFVERPGPAALHHININCRDIARSGRWYREVLGFEPVSELRDEVLPGECFGIHGSARTLSQRWSLPGRESDCVLQLQQWLEPAASGAPYPCANHLGFYRVAFAVDDARGCYRELLALGADCPYAPVWMDMGPDIPIEGLWALFFRDPDGTCVELIQNPQLVA